MGRVLVRCGAVWAISTPRSRADSIATPHIELRQVAQSTVDQLGTPPGRAEGEVVRIERGHRQSTRCGVERDPGTGHTQTDDEQVNHLAVGQHGQFGGPAGGVERGR